MNNELLDQHLRNQALAAIRQANHDAAARIQQLLDVEREEAESIRAMAEARASIDAAAQREQERAEAKYNAQKAEAAAREAERHQEMETARQREISDPTAAALAHILQALKSAPGYGNSYMARHVEAAERCIGLLKGQSR